MENAVFYLCDKRACPKCNSGSDNKCTHTLDISHAVNFKKDLDGNYWEKEAKPVIIFQTDNIIPAKVLERCRQELVRQVTDGVILVGPDIRVCSESGVYDMTITKR